jgi:MFS family permease
VTALDQRRGWRARISVAGLYAGGFLGPFGGAVTASVLPEVGSDFGISAGAASATVTAYLIPFAGLMLVSGTLGERWGARRAVRVAYVVYVLASVLCAVSWSFPLLLGGRVVQGAANAFITPLLLGTIAAVTPAQRLGRTLGVFASMQAAGQTFAPLVGGVAAEASWRWAFVGAAVVATGLTVLGVPAHADTSDTEQAAPTLRSAWRPAVLRIAAVAFVGWGCLGGLTFLVAFRLGDTFGLSASQRGLVLTGFGIVGMLTASVVGRTIDNVGARLCVVAGACVGAALLALIGLLPSLFAVGSLWALTGASSQFLIVGLNTLVLSTTGGNRGGAVSVVQAFRFLGASASPIAFVPLYHLHPAAAFVAPAALIAVTAPGLLLTGRRP